MNRVLLATRNRKKLVELQRILDGALGAHRIALLGLDDVEQYPELPETGLTFGENALIKAREACRRTGLPTIADDSGLAVDALNGMPGVFSARWAGRHGDDLANLQLVLDQIADLPDEHRAASFVCTVALVLPGGKEHLVDGRQSGRLLRAPRGDGGFGYDPIFLGDGQQRTNAELTPEEKDAVSHRGKALRELAKLVAKVLPPAP
ncbi:MULTISPECIES: RdgB/HAM1 family non-canonical purine NTP pyrophosphatase [Micromonospora]|uniref:dITP/XTP pyrophosphatase n=1 Tax=Micromonospora sicca TaxID=2202420 RepID=A0A317DJF5_9ACTN|nr:MULTISPECIES: RdgB/HAM1 family non-canonical purine NTP pyrophosphatase [unclassified Micromonospora]MBM0226475.1 RdgB/HAM1 family non-canonical purine NTP pyrophosphatase [Micromonospora sp. ATA51]MDZ5441444.1 RdgB/HAM1 family non-canonical purine NTP pyrophosphatase [Micromonospora sp. 4G57]MDZ5492874.1 RdgB/HAM1 family non-canonical purine NTP pyrophosphatase [Micromonospora sp. 4G53]PWR14778.1 non-canonical purine NTP pyrophosphatase, RdgB/HAM1 family [Micromonospora sp. 4G51]